MKAQAQALEARLKEAVHDRRAGDGRGCRCRAWRKSREAEEEGGGARGESAPARASARTQQEWVCVGELAAVFAADALA